MNRELNHPRLRFFLSHNHPAWHQFLSVFVHSLDTMVFSSASRTQRNRLLAGLIGFPIVVGVLCFLLYMT